MERVILPDCCEDWILNYGPYYDPDSEFECIECGTPWHKLEPHRFQETHGGRVWVEKTRSAEGQRFRYLEPETGEGALTNRCCAKLILDYGERLKVGKEFICPLCGTQWKKEAIQHRSGMRVDGYTNQVRGVTIAIQKGTTRNYLVPVDDYRAPVY